MYVNAGLIIATSSIFQKEAHGRNQFPLCPQKAAIKASGPGVDKGDNKTGPREGTVSGGVHGRGGAS